MSLTLLQQSLVLCGIPLVCELVLGGVLFCTNRQAEAEAHKQMASRTIIEAANATAADLNLSAAWMVELDRQKLRLGVEAFMRLHDDLESLKELVQDSPAQLAIVERALARWHEAYRVFLQGRDIRKSVGTTLSLAAYVQLQHCFKQMAILGDAMVADLKAVVTLETQELARQGSEPILSNEDNRLSALVTFALALMAAIAAALAIQFNKSTVSHLKGIVTTAGLLAKRQALPPAQTGRDEISTLDAAIHKMAAAIERSTREQRSIIAYASDVILSLDEHGKLVDVSPAALPVLGYTPAELTGTSFANLLRGDNERFSILLSQHRSETIELEARHKDGRQLDLLFSARWSEGEQAFFCIVHDNTSQKQLEKVKEQLLATMNEELTQPLLALGAVNQALFAGQYGQLNASGLAKLEATQRQVARMLSLMQDVIALDNLDAGRFHLEQKETSLPAIIERAVEALQTVAAQRQVKIATGSLCDQSIIADENRLEQVLTNLLSNAIKYTEPGTTITASCIDAGDRLEVLVEDCGPGVPPDLAEAIFERFRQVQAADARRLRGTGLGLYICKMLIEGHGGAIGVRPRLPAGSTFWFTLPKAGTASGGRQAHALEA